MHKRGVQSVNCVEEDIETPPAKRIPESGPQDTPKLPSQRLYSAISEVVLQACLFTIIELPSQNSVETLPSIEQTTQQDQPPMLTSSMNNPMVDECCTEHAQEQGEEKCTGPSSNSEPINHPETEAKNKADGFLCHQHHTRICTSADKRV